MVEAVIDTHCHLTFPDFAGNIGAVLTQAAEAGITGAITISTTTQDCLEALEIARSYPRVWCTSGVHPLYADPLDRRAAGRSGGGHTWANLRTVALDPKCVAWGELGLDNHYPEPASAVQRRVLDEQLAYIRSVNHAGEDGIGRPDGLPFVLHCREAFADLIPVLRQSGVAGERCVFHCFTGNTADAQKVLDFGGMISFTGVLTYPNAGDLRAAARSVPVDRMMVETDAPFLPPVPHRGKRPCYPAYVAHTARALAEIVGMPFEALHERLNENTRRFFGIDAR